MDLDESGRDAEAASTHDDCRRSAAGESLLMERTGTFEARMQEVVAAERALTESVREALRMVDAAHEDFVKDYREQEAHEAELEKERREFERRWLLQPNYWYSENNAEMAFISDQLAEESGSVSRDELVERAILGRKVHHGVLYYKVAWRGRNLVTWEREDNVDNKKLIAEFEAWFMSRAAIPRSTRFRPPVYISRRLKAMSAELRQRLEVVRESEGGQVVWTCEVEPFIWIPYDDEAQPHIERSFAAGRDAADVSINGTVYRIYFASMLQHRAPSAPPSALHSGTTAAAASVPPSAQGRQVRRCVQMTPEAESRLMERMTVDELREYIATISEIMPHHYEALQRFHDADKVPQSVSQDQLRTALFVDRFDDVMNAVVDGRVYPCFTSECFVCLEDYVGTDELAHLVCGHFFHKHCAYRYFERYSRLCPICKEDVL